MSPELVVTDLSVNFGGLKALTDVTLTLEGHRAIGLIGPNGAGKSTLLNVLSGFQRPSSGTVTYNGADLAVVSPERRAKIGMLRTFQTAQLMDDESAFSNVMLGNSRFSTAGAIRQLFGAPRHRRLEKTWTYNAYATLDSMGLLDVADQPVGGLSSATRRLVEIARALQAQPDVLLLDEPAAGLDAGSRETLAALLSTLPVELSLLLILVEHDVNIVRKSCPTSIALVSGKTMAADDTDTLLQRADVRAAYFGETDADTH